MTRRGWVTNWDPNDESFWVKIGQSVARRNLVFSIFAEFLGFLVWQLWSVVAINLNKTGFHLSVSELFWLVSIPGLVGATMRFPYGFAVPYLGGRTWTTISAALLLIPTILLGVLVQHPTTPFWLLAVAAGTAGFGGGNFASSMSNISFFYPDKRKGWALGLNAAGGNIGVAVVQFVVPAVIGLGILGLGAKAAGKHLSLAAAGFAWVPFVLAAAVCAWLFMDNLAVARTSVRAQAQILRRKHTWVMSWLYIGTFGSFIGYSAAFPLLIKTQFHGVNPLEFAFLGPLIGSLARPLGGRLSDRVGGSVVTLVNFVCMIGAVLGVIAVLGHKTAPGAFALFFAAFTLLFVTAGMGNGSTFRMIPAIFRTDRLKAAEGQGAEALAAADLQGRREAAGVLAFSSALGAYGSFLIPQGFNLSLGHTGSLVTALCGFIGFYVSCVVLTWVFYMRPVTTPPVMVQSEEAALDEAAVLVGVEAPALARVRA
jgi:NNP family nitrate/nitrite transporter-like MFS transporter